MKWWWTVTNEVELGSRQVHFGDVVGLGGQGHKDQGGQGGQEEATEAYDLEGT